MASEIKIETAIASGTTPGVAPAWYCIRTHLKHEHIAAAHLELLPEVKVFSPQLRLLRSTRRGPVWFTESLFPNYLFARFDLDALLEKVRFTTAVAAVVHFGDVAPVIPDSVIAVLQRDMEVMKSKVLTDIPEEGEDVEVASGSFKGLNGTVVRVLPARQRVQVLLDFMGRATAVEVSLSQLIFRKRDAAGLVLSQAQPVIYSGASTERRKNPSRQKGAAL